MKKLNIEELKSLVVSILIMMIGIFFCCSLSIGIAGLSIIIGLVLMVIGVLFLVNAFVGGKGLYSMESIVGVVILSLGIVFLVHKLAGIIFAYIPWLLIILGAVVIVDGLIYKFLKSEDNLFKFIVKMVIGGVAIILGLCLQLIDGFMEYASIILGILMIIYAGYLMYRLFFGVKTPLTE